MVALRPKLVEEVVDVALVSGGLIDADALPVHGLGRPPEETSEVPFGRDVALFDLERECEELRQGTIEQPLLEFRAERVVYNINASVYDTIAAVTAARASSQPGVPGSTPRRSTLVISIMRSSSFVETCSLALATYIIGAILYIYSSRIQFLQDA